LKLKTLNEVVKKVIKDKVQFTWMLKDPIEPIKIFYRGKGTGEVIDIALCQF